ncbi:hypothetical protein [Cellulomonas citrea]|uniref:hypothetical protein n=1 Tax=Cellulomonas citrea TaxID=1909423 RepID=UPI001359B9BE|nr:hypothetical protein [Cellulomonas citrea]
MGSLRTQVDALERQRADASRRLRSAIAAALRQGRTQRDLAAELDRSQPEIHRLATTSAPKDAAGRPRTWMTARSAADAARRELADGDPMMAFRMLTQALDHLSALEDADDVAEWAVTPAPIRDERFDTLLLALTRRAFDARGLRHPDWATPHRLPTPWVLAATPARAERVRASTPPDLAALNLFVSAKDLVTA